MVWSRVPRSLIFLIAALALGACQQGGLRARCAQGAVCIEYGNHGEPATLDPQKASLVDEATIISDLMMGLTTDAADGATIPGAATSWTVSPDGLVWTFRLRAARWSDGVPVTADDFVFAYRRLLAPETAAIYARMLYLLANGQAVHENKVAPESLGVQALDDRTLRLTLAHPVPYLPGLLKHFTFFPVPRHVVQRWGDEWVRPGRYVGNGAFKLTAWRLGDYVEVVRNRRFWDAARVCPDRIRYYPTTDSVSAERRVARGELDLNTDFQSNRLARIERATPGYARTKTALATAYMFLNSRDVPPLRDIRVRRALSEAIDREFITHELMRAGQEPAFRFVPPGTSGRAAGPRLRWADRTFAQRQADARALLAQAGYGPKRPLKLEIKTANAGGSLTMTEAIQADWRAIGVETTLTRNEGQVLFAAYRERDFQVGLAQWYADYDDPLTFLDLLRADTGAQNYADYANPAYDALLAAADREPDARRRAALLGRAEQMMLDDEAIAPLYFVVSRNLVSPRVTGWVDNPQNVHRARWLCLRRP